MVTRGALINYPRLLLVLSLAIGSSACSKAEPTKDELLSQAKTALAAEQYDKAEKVYREVLRRSPEDPTALRQLGIIYRDQGQLIQAYPLLKKAAELQPEDQELQLKLGSTLLAVSGEREQAREIATLVLEKQPGQEEALLILADASRTPEEVEDARKIILRAREKDQDRAGYHLAQGLLDLRQNDRARAETEFKTALDLDPKSSEAHVALGTLYWSRNELKEADQSLKAAAELATQRSPMRLRYADFLIKTGDGEQAKNLLQEINNKAPDYLPARVYLMKMACAKQQDEDCAARVQDVLAQDPVNYDAVFWDGMLSLTKRDAPRKQLE
jgi:cellulose synthase operon protein C